eukprot:6745409-Ditylum_brightwellii.AAC.1
MLWYKTLPLVLAISSSHLFRLSTAFQNNDNVSYNVPSFSLSNLLENNGKRLKETLSTTGILAITRNDDDDRYDKVSTEALRSLCHCHYSSSYSSFMSQNTMSDGVERTTIGTATAGGWKHPLPLSDSLSDICQDDRAKQNMEDLRDAVVHVSKAFVRAIDTLITSSSSSDDDDAAKSVLMEDIYGTSFTSMNSIITSSTSLEHFHLYSKPSSQQDTTTTTATTIATHTDAGLFLSFVPAQSCSSSSQDEDDDAAFYVEIDGVLQQATFPKNS